MVKTEENLKAAFSGESQANRMYTAFAKKADEEGYKQVAHLFRAAAAAETVHALNHLEVIGKVKSTTENLKQGIDGESFEYRKMYPEYMENAKNEKNNPALRTFTLAKKVEEVHYGLYQKALEQIEKKEKIADKPIYVCQTCGNTVEGEAPDRCPICGAPKAKFQKID